MIQHRAYSAPASLMKIAFDGEWEKAQIFERGALKNKEDARVLVAGQCEVACEAFFGDAFFGVRRRGVPDELVTFVWVFASRMANAKTGHIFFEHLTRELNIPIAQKFKFAEVGAVDAWKSVGPFEIKNPLYALHNWDQFMTSLRASAVWREQEHVKAVEFAFDNGDGTTHWFALPVSDGALILPEKLEGALREYVDQRATVKIA
jgi:hypothetical protein